MEKINMLNLNCCDIPTCNCGANITLGFSKGDMPKLLKLLFNNFKIQSCISYHTILGITQDTEFPLAECLGCGIVIENNGEPDCPSCKGKPATKKEIVEKIKQNNREGVRG